MKLGEDDNIVLANDWIKKNNSSLLHTIAYNRKTNKQRKKKKIKIIIIIICKRYPKGNRKKNQNK